MQRQLCYCRPKYTLQQYTVPTLHVHSTSTLYTTCTLQQHTVHYMYTVVAHAYSVTLYATCTLQQYTVHYMYTVVVHCTLHVHSISTLYTTCTLQLYTVHYMYTVVVHCMYTVVVHCTLHVHCRHATYYCIERDNTAEATLFPHCGLPLVKGPNKKKKTPKGGTCWVTCMWCVWAQLCYWRDVTAEATGVTHYMLP